MTFIGVTTALVVAVVGGSLFVAFDGRPVAGRSSEPSTSSGPSASASPLPTRSPAPALTFRLTGSMSVARIGQTATLLQDGRVLIAGGLTDGVSAELYDPKTDSFSPTAPMSVARASHTATLLADGRVLIAGGNGDTDSGLMTAELYDPKTGRFTRTGFGPGENHNATPRPNWTCPPGGNCGTVFLAMRDGHTATLLADGRVLIAGGGGLVDPLASALLYDPATGQFTATGSMGTPRSGHTATLLSDGRVLVIGGVGAGGNLTSAELYDPATGTFSATGPTTVGRTNAFTASLLEDGRVLVAGGPRAGADPNNWSADASAELYDPATGTFSPTGSMTAGRVSHTATVMSDGRVLIVGGDGETGAALSSFEIYDPSTGTFSLGGPMVVAREGHTATLLSDGRILVAGGFGDSGSYLASAEICQP
jgi:hypothetical protein